MDEMTPAASFGRKRLVGAPEIVSLRSTFSLPFAKSIRKRPQAAFPAGSLHIGRSMYQAVRSVSMHAVEPPVANDSPVETPRLLRTLMQ